jgi:hypothetical protein
MNSEPATISGVLARVRRTATAVSVSAHITIRQASPAPAGAESRKAGVAVPAMRKKIIAWSRFRSRSLQAALQVPRWYSALVPKRALRLAA